MPAHAPGLADGDYEGFDTLLKALFDELAFDLPGLYGEHPLDGYFALSPAGYSQSFTAGIVNEYGTKLLAMAGLVNLLALADAFTKEKSA